MRALVSPLPGAFYEVGGREVVVDEFLTISQVASLKYGGPGGATLGADSFALEPVPDASRNDVIEFRAGRGGVPRIVGSLRVDWDGSRTAETSLAVGGDQAEVAVELIERFAASELSSMPLLDDDQQRRLAARARLELPSTSRAQRTSRANGPR